MVLSQQVDLVTDIAKMLKAFVMCEMYSVVDRLANATSKEAVEMALYEALRAARSASVEGRSLCEKRSGEKVRPYVASEEAISTLLKKLDEDLVSGLDLVRKIVLKALSM